MKKVMESHGISKAQKSMNPVLSCLHSCNGRLLIHFFIHSSNNLICACISCVFNFPESKSLKIVLPLLLLLDKTSVLLA